MMIIFVESSNSQNTEKMDIFEYLMKLRVFLRFRFQRGKAAAQQPYYTCCSQACAICSETLFSGYNTDYTDKALALANFGGYRKTVDLHAAFKQSFG